MAPNAPVWLAHSSAAYTLSGLALLGSEGGTESSRAGRDGPSVVVRDRKRWPRCATPARRTSQEALQRQQDRLYVVDGGPLVLGRVPTKPAPLHARFRDGAGRVSAELF